MPQVTDGPKKLNDLLEQVYSECIASKKSAKYCSKIAWTAVENAGWAKDKDGKWHKKSAEEAKKDMIAKTAGINRNKKKGIEYED